jgi:hypothetical protein
LSVYTDKPLLSIIITDGIDSICNTVDIYRQTTSGRRLVYTDGLLSSVYTDHIANGIYRILKRWNSVMTWSFFKRFYRWNDRGIQTGIFVQWRGPFTVRMTDGYTDGTCSLMIPSVIAKIYPLCRLSPPLFLLLLPHPNSPLPNSPPLLNTSTQVSYTFVHGHNIRSLINLLWILSFFLSKSILFSFNI